MKTNITVVSLFSKFTKDIAQDLADKLEMYFVDIQDLMEFNLVNDNEVINLCGIEYLNKLQYKTIKDVSGYDNSVISVDFKFMFDKKNIENLKVRSSIVFLELTEDKYKKMFEKYKNAENFNDDVIETSVFEEHNNIAKEFADIVIDVGRASNKTLIKKIIKNVEKYYEQGKSV